MRVRTLSVVLCSSLTIAALTAGPGSGRHEELGLRSRWRGGRHDLDQHSASGGASPTTPAKPAKPLHLSPITAKTPNVAYNGPVYEKTATGQVVPYQPSPPALTPGQASGATGGSAVAATATTTKPDLLVPGTLARYVNGLAAAPMSAPPAVQEIIWAGNELIGLPYIYGGGPRLVHLARL